MVNNRATRMSKIWLLEKSAYLQFNDFKPVTKLCEKWLVDISAGKIFLGDLIRRIIFGILFLRFDVNWVSDSIQGQNIF